MVGQNISQYRLVDVLGEGGMGTVYVAEHHVLKRRVAIKTLKLIPGKQHYRARFLREACSASALNHPNIATVYDYGETEGGVPYIIMELVEGQTLQDLLQSGTLTIRRALDIVESVALALAEAHRHNIIHRDIKPTNVALDKRGEVKVLDFGLAKQLGADSGALPSGEDAQANIATQTCENTAVGTPMYSSPEQTLGATVDARSDLFSLGALLYECVTGWPAFPGSKASEVRSKVIRDNPPTPSRVNPDVPPALDRVAMKALAKGVEDRYQTAEEMIEDLRQIRGSLQGGKPRPVLPAPPKTDAVRTSVLNVISERLRQPRWLAVAFLASLAMALTAVWAGTSWRHRTAGSHSREALELYREGANALRNGAYYKAVKVLQQAVSVDDDFPLAHARLAEALTEMEYTDRAKDELLRVSRTQSGRPELSPLEALYLQAINLSLTGDSKGAIATYERIVEQSPEEERAAASVDLGRACERDGDLKRAMLSYESALKLDAQSSAAATRLGVLYGRRLSPDNTERALSYFKNAEARYEVLTDVEGLAEVLYQRGVMYVTQRRLDDAEAQLSQALVKAGAIDNKYQQVRARMQLSSVYCLKGDTQTAERYAAEALDFAKANGLENSTANGLVTLGNAFLVRKDLGQAQKYFERALEMAQLYKARRSEARSLLALASLTTEYHSRPDEVRGYVERAVNLYQQEGSRKYLMQAQALLGHASEEQGDYAVAQQAFTQQLQLAVQLGDPEQESLAYEGLGIAFMYQEDYPRALENLDRHYQISRELKLAPSVGYVQLKRGRVLFAVGRYDEARKALDESKEVAAGHPDAALLSRQPLAEAQLALSRREFEAARVEGLKALKLAGGQFETVAVEAEYTAGLAEALSGRTREGLRLCGEAYEAAERLNSPQLAAAALLALATVRLAAGEAQEALAAALRARERFASAGQRESEWRALLVAALASQRAGDPDAARNHAALAAETLGNFRRRLTAADDETYRARPDVSYALSQLDGLLTTAPAGQTQRRRAGD
jgi:serine/threonine protein kinase